MRAGASETVRSFFAIELDGEMRSRLARQAEAVVARVRGLRAVPESNLHLTVRFLGEVGGAELAHLESLASGLAEGLAPFRLELHGLGRFPGALGARVVWVGARDPGSLQVLWRRVGEASHGIGQADARPFHPHVTIARARGILDGPALAAEMELLREQAYGSVAVSALVLLETRPGTRSAREYHRRFAVVLGTRP